MNTTVMNDGIAVCRELGRAVAYKEPLDSPLPPVQTVSDFCDAHQLHALYASAVSLRRALPPEHQALIARGLQRTAKQIKTDAIEESLSRLFTKEGIRHIVLKGSHTRTFYPAHLSRTSADIDWQIAPADSELADALLLQNGWTLKSADADERCYEKVPHTRLELHLAPEGFSQKQQDIMQRLFGNIVAEEGLRFHLSDSAAYVYAVFHIYKHFVFAGAGVRMFLDVFAIDTHGDLDRAYIDENLTALGCEGFEKRVRQINDVLFADAQADDELTALIRFVFASQAYGVQAVQLALESYNTSLTGQSPFQKFLRNYCFDAASMKTRYPCLNRTMWLYPFCAVHRLCHGFVFRRTILKKAVDDRKQSHHHREDVRRILQLASIL